MAKSLVVHDRAVLAARYPTLLKGDYRSRAIVLALVAGAAALFVFALIRFEFSFAKLHYGIFRLIEFVGLMFPPSAGNQFPLFMQGLAETLSIAFLGTLLACVFAFPLGMLAARNVLPAFIARFLVRRSMDTLRSVDTLIWALIWINVVGLGPFAGILAIASTDIGALSKLFSEAIENVDRKSEEGVMAAGGGFFQRIRFGLLPEAFPVMAGQVLYFIESNTRSATIVGIVGAGGLGLYLTESIRTLDWDRVSYLIIIVLITVAVIDFVSSRLRLALIGTKQAPI
jgi:phosphonate transport system permease protein